jgi:hypothetical protein
VGDHDRPVDCVGGVGPVVVEDGAGDDVLVVKPQVDTSLSLSRIHRVYPLPVVERNESIGEGHVAREEHAGLSVMPALTYWVVIISGGLGTFMNFGDGRGKCQGSPLKKFRYGGSVTRHSVGIRKYFS